MPSLKTIVIYLLLVAMELAAAFCFLVGSGLIDAIHAGNGILGLLLLAGVGGLGTGLGIALVAPAEPWNRIAQLVGAVAWTIPPTALAGHEFAASLITIALLLVAYWRGLRLSLEPADTDAVRREFGLGFVVVFLAFLWGISRDVNHTQPFWAVLALTGIGYTLTAMIALGVARLERQREPGSGFAVFVAVAVQLGIVLLLAFAAIAIFGHDIAGSIGNATRPFFDAIGSVGYRVLLLIAGPFQWLIDLIRGQQLAHRPPTITRPHQPVPTNRKRPHIGHVDHTLSLVIGLVALSLLAIAIGYVVWRLLPRIPRYRATRGYSDERRTLLTPADMLRAIIAWLKAWLRTSGQGVVQAMARTRKRIWGSYPEDPVRRIYAQVLRRSASAGLTRPSSATPDEFGRRIAARWPDTAFGLGAITEAYVQRRYGEIVPEASRVDALAVHWQQVRTAIRVVKQVPDASADAAARPDQPPASASPASPRAWPAWLLAILGDPYSGVGPTLLTWLVCLLVPIAVGLVLFVAILLLRL